MLEMPRVVFGRPTNFTEGLYRLPASDHPLLSTGDQMIIGLYMLREILRQTIEGQTDTMVPYVPGNLSDRMVNLTREELIILERCSFRRRNWNVQDRPWATIWDGNNPWAEVYGIGDERYKHWRICRMEPQPLGRKWLLVCIETNRNYHSDIELEFDVGLVTHFELQQLLDGLDRPTPTPSVSLSQFWTK